MSSSGNHCMTPGCPNMAAGGDTKCPTCRAMSRDTAISMLPIFHDEPDEGWPASEDVTADIGAIAAFVQREQQRQDDVIRRQQRQIEHQAKTINDLGHRLGAQIQRADAEKARANGLQQQLDGLRQQVIAQGGRVLTVNSNGHARNDPTPRRWWQRLRRTVGG